MTEIDHTLEQRLRKRIEEQIACEARGDVSMLYEFFDPNIRQKRASECNFESDRTISQFGEFVGHVQSAELESIEIADYTNDGGAVRDHRPTALAVISVLYNGNRRNRFRTPWVLHNNEWYTLAIGKIWGA